MTQDIGQTLLDSLNNGFGAIISFVPKIIAGTIVLLIGIIIASILKQIVLGIFRALRIENLLKKYGVPEAKQEFSWSNIFAEIIRWFVIIIFLLPTADIWGLPRVVTILNEFLLYLPNVFVAAVIALVGFVIARLVHDVVLVSAKKVDAKTASGIATVARWAVNIFVILAVLNQLGVAPDLVRILFTGLVAMLALAGGLAFGLGGQDAAKDALDGLRKRLKQ